LFRFFFDDKLTQTEIIFERCFDFFLMTNSHKLKLLLNVASIFFDDKLTQTEIIFERCFDFFFWWQTHTNWNYFWTLLRFFFDD